ncbi:uncharacterized protein LOC126982900 [Eriocheir sinensis]|uniref:uncharacterized protein LOC126982900 n=1 Tax=Eriocheir sinensis TaxID=95602 RepID=UPI0021C678BE|nr:uncharacterized protein LOC126982900 [Eriocheir sinensis]
MPPLRGCEQAGRKRQGVLAVFIAVLLTMVVVNTLTYPGPAPLQPPGRRGRSHVTPHPPLPQFGETLVGWLSKAVIVDLLIHGTKEEPVWGLSVTRYPVVTRYVIRSPPPHPLDLSREGDGPLGSSLSRVQDFFAYLKAPRRRCRKQVMMGGNHQCGEVTDDISDGRKVVCLDAELQLQPRRRPQSCLTLSFGIHRDTSFDAAMAAMNCEVHMFDLLNYTPSGLLRRAPHAHFHQVGLAEKRLQRYYLNLGQELPVDSLEGHLITNNLMYRPIHLLKMDIEGDEWVVLKQVAQQPIMDLIGQIAIEIHSEDLLTLPAKKHLSYLQDKYNVLRAIENRGFEKIAYWDNTKSKVYKDTSGASYNTCGEIHFVNTNWYNTSFKSTLKSMSIHFP